MVGQAAMQMLDDMRNFRLSDYVKGVMGIQEPMFITGSHPVFYSYELKREITPSPEVKYVPGVQVDYRTKKATNNRKTTRGRKRFYISVVKPVVETTKVMVNNRKGNLVERIKTNKYYTALVNLKSDEGRKAIIKRIMDFSEKGIDAVEAKAKNLKYPEIKTLISHYKDMARQVPRFVETAVVPIPISN